MGKNISLMHIIYTENNTAGSGGRDSNMQQWRESGLTALVVVLLL